MSFHYEELQPGFGDHCWRVHKFGGTSVANADCFLQVAKIIEDQLDVDRESIIDDALEDDNVQLHPSESVANLAVVVSAMGGKPKVTDLLLSAVRYASMREHDQVEEVLGVVLEKHERCLNAIFHEERGEYSEEKNRLLQVIQGGLDDIRDILKTVSLMKWQAERISEVVSGYGELWSSQILT